MCIVNSNGNKLQTLCAGISPNGNWIIATNSKCIKLWKIRVKKGNLTLEKVLSCTKRGCSSFAFSDNSNQLFLTPIPMKRKNKIPNLITNQEKQDKSNVSRIIPSIKSGIILDIEIQNVVYQIPKGLNQSNISHISFHCIKRKIQASQSEQSENAIDGFEYKYKEQLYVICSDK